MTTTTKYLSATATVAALLTFGPLPATASTLVDAGIRTIDAATGLQWLDLSATDGLSKSQVEAQMVVGGTFADYRYAAYDEVATFWLNAGIIGGRFDSNWYPENVQPTLALAGLMGGFTGNSGGGCLDILGGITGTATSNGNFQAPYIFLSNRATCLFGLAARGEHNYNASPTSADPVMGSWLVAYEVAAIPEPQTVALMLCGVVVLAMKVRQSHNRKMRGAATATDV